MNNNKVYILTFTPEDINNETRIVGVYKTKEGANKELDEIINEYIEHNEAYNVTREDAINYYNPEISPYTVFE
jgi:hypothetical protein